MITLGEGLHPDIPEDVYHADPCEQASLSSSVAVPLLDRSPWHAWGKHPRLNPDFREKAEEKNDRARDMGSAAHALMLGAGRAVRPLEFTNYKKDAAKDAAAAARQAGEIPLVQPDYDDVQAMVAAGKEQLARTELAGIFDDGDPELTMIWRDQGTWCRSRVDYLPRIVRQGGHVIVPDYKTTAGSAHPDDFASTIRGQAYDMRAAFYERGLRALIPTIRTIEFVFVVQEQDFPYALSLVGMPSAQVEVSATRADLAIRLWATCMATGKWPGYPRRISRADVPNWWVERNELNTMALKDRLARWQSPLHMKEQSDGNGQRVQI